MTHGHQDTGFHQYDQNVLEVMGECLTSALVEVVKKKPADPVEYLAHYLYNYRKNNPLKTEVFTFTQECGQESAHVHSDVELFDHRPPHQRECQATKLNLQIVHLELQAVFKQIDDFF